ncbi:MAG: hypothetical protein M3R57_09380 [Chloroflexota bacterium]|nr:hypothetical protein [Chloroflexota bacterium]
MRRSVAAAVLLTASLLLAATAPVAAFPLSLCQLSLSSKDANGTTIDSAESGANDSTQADPFLVDWDGTVAYSGTTTNVIKDYTYQVYVFGAPTPIRGADTNSEQDVDGSGTVGVSANAPFRITGLFKVSGTYTGAGGSCAGDGWFKLIGDPTGTVLFWIGLIIVALGAALLLRGLRGHTLSAVLGGLLVGLGSALLLVIYSVLPFAEYTPWAVLGLGLLLGIIVAVLGRRGGGSAEPMSPEPLA